MLGTSFPSFTFLHELKVLYLGECRFVADPTRRTLPSLFRAGLTLRALISFDRLWYWRAEGLRELSLEYDHCFAQEVEGFLDLTVNPHVLFHHIPHPRPKPGDPAQPPTPNREEFNFP